MYWVWSILLLAVGLGLAVTEVFFPSAGVLGFLAAAAILASIILGFQQNVPFGMGVLMGALFGVPAIVIAAFKLWPRTKFGRRVMLAPPTADEVLPDDEQRQYLRGLVGRVGRAKCMMLPGGVIQIDGHTIEAVSEGVAIEEGQAVRVIQVRGARAVVRRCDDEVPSETAADPMQRPIETLLPDPFDEESAGKGGTA